MVTAMARKARVQAVFKVTLWIPTNGTLADAQKLVKDGILHESKTRATDDPMRDIDEEKVRVALDSKHTYY